MAIRYENYFQNVNRTWGIRESTNARFGFEIETGWRSQGAMQRFFAAMEAMRLDNYVMAKEDSTINAAYDAEVVSRPLVFPEAKRVARRVIDAYRAQPEGNRTLNGCGVHIHTTRAAWSKATLLLVRRAIMGLAQDQERYYSGSTYAGQNPSILRNYTTTFWDAVATRSPNEWCGRNDGLEGTRLSNVGYGEEWNVRTAFSNWNRNGSHYDAVSWSSRGPTIEFRLWGSSANARTIASYLDAVDALLRYCKHVASELAISDSTLVKRLPFFNPKAFAEWVHKQSGYQALKWRFKNATRVKSALRQCPEVAPLALQESVMQETLQVETPRTASVISAFDSEHVSERCILDNGREMTEACTCPCRRCADFNALDEGRHHDALVRARAREASF